MRCKRRDALLHVGLEGRVREGGRGARRADERGRHGVDVDAVRTPLDRVALGQVRDRRLGRAVDRLARQRDEAGLRAHVHDAPAALLDHHPRHGLTGEEEALDVEVEGAVEIGLCPVLGRLLLGTQPGVVDEDVDAPERVPHRLDGRSDLRQVQQVHLHAQRPPPHAFDLGREILRVGRHPQPEGHVRTGIRERQGDGSAQATRGARHQCRLAVEPEARVVTHLSLSSWRRGVARCDQTSPSTRRPLRPHRQPLWILLRSTGRMARLTVNN